MSKRSIAQFISRFLPQLPSRAALEMAYLNGSVSLYDLEAREREVDRGKFAAY